MPNPNTLEWLHYQDIQIPDMTLRQQFRQYIQVGNYDQALLLLIENADQLQGKAYIAEVINTIIEGVVNLEERYNTGVTEYLSNLETQFETLINNFKNLTAWQSFTQYVPYNFVSYNQQIYMCFSQPPIGTLPTDTTYWLYLGLQGEAGTPGIDVNMTYDWNSGTPYQPNDLVVYQGNIYCAKIANTNVLPTETGTWTLFLVLGEGKINVGVNPPANPTRDMIWFQTQSDPDTATTGDPILGTFQRYNLNTQAWDPMYPNVLFTWIVGADEYAPIKIVEDVTIQPAQWQGNTWTYSNSGITDTSSVEVWPNNLNNAQYALYNSLTIQVSAGQIVFNTTNNPTVDLPIIITIQ